MTASTCRPRRGAGRIALAALALGAATLAGPATRSAFAFIQYQVVDPDTKQPTGVYIKWNRSHIDLTAYPNDLTEMTFDQVSQAAAAAAAAWSTESLPCTYLNVAVTDSMAATRPAGQDAYNVLVFRNPWCDPDKPDECQPEALAITSVFAGRSSGTIHDADIEVNTQNFIWGDLASQPGVGKQDLQNALTHEMGHFIGLDHNCYTPGVDPYHQTDNTGAPAPLCAGADPSVQDDTMYTKAEFGDLSKRTLEADDVNAVCTIYNVDNPPTNDPGGCDCGLAGTTAASAASGVPAVAALLATALARRRRKAVLRKPTRSGPS